MEKDKKMRGKINTLEKRNRSSFSKNQTSMLNDKNLIPSTVCPESKVAAKVEKQIVSGQDKYQVYKVATVIDNYQMVEEKNSMYMQHKPFSINRNGLNSVSYVTIIINIGDMADCITYMSYKATKSVT